MNKYKYAPWLIVLAALLWAVDAPFRTFLTTELSSTTIVLMEHLLIAVLVFVFLGKFLKELKNLSWREWLAVAFIAIGGSALATVFFTQSFVLFNFKPTVPILLQKIQPFFAILFASIFLKEKLTKQFWVWALLGIVGGYLLTFPDARITAFDLDGQTRGALFAILAAFFWGGSTVFGRYVLRKVSFQAMTAIRFLVALVFLIFLNIYFGTLSEVSQASTKDWLYVCIIAILVGFIALFIYYRGLRDTRASIAIMSELAFPLSSVVVSWVFLDAPLTWIQIAGGIILLFAITRLSLVNQREAEVNNQQETR